MRKDVKTTLIIADFAGRFAENKDEAAEKRKKFILPELKAGKTIVLDYEGVTSTTQSFTHALISQALRTFGPKKALSKILFRNCNENVKRIIGIVVEYMQ